MCVIWLNNGEENRLTVPLLDAIDECWRLAEREGARVVATASRTRFYSNGVDLQKGNEAGVLERLVGLMRRIVSSKVPSVACLTGHAVGGGLLLALAHDWRLCRSDKGLFFVPAVELGIELPLPLIELARAKLGLGAAAQLLLSRDKLRGVATKELGIVHDVVHAPGEDAVETMLKSAERYARDAEQQPAYAHMKRHLFDSVLALKAKL